MAPPMQAIRAQTTFAYYSRCLSGIASYFIQDNCADNHLYEGKDNFGLPPRNQLWHGESLGNIYIKFILQIIFYIISKM